MHDSIARKDPTMRRTDDACPVCAFIEKDLRARAHLEHDQEKDKPETESRQADGRRTRYVPVSDGESAPPRRS